MLHSLQSPFSHINHPSPHHTTSHNISHLSRYHDHDTSLKMTISSSGVKGIAGSHSPTTISSAFLVNICLGLAIFHCTFDNANAFLSVGRSSCRSKGIHMRLGRQEEVDKGFNLLETASKVVPQGQIVNTVKETWKFGWKRMMAELAPQDKTGSYKRPSYNFGGKIGDPNFPDEAGRYHLYTGNPCPWCHRARLVVGVKGIRPSEVGMTQLVDDPVKASRGGWIFSTADRDPLANCRDLRELYDTLSPGFTGRCTAPLLIDLKSKTIVSNESSDIVRMLNSATWGRSSDEPAIDLYPSDSSTEIDDTNEWVYRLLNNGVYRCGFSTTQSAYDKASADVREGLNRCETLLSNQDFLCGSQLTEADLRLLPTMLRFDGVYSPLFKAGGTHLRVRDYPNLHAWLKRCWAIDGVKESIDLADANQSYYKQLFPLNPGGIIPSTVTAAELGLE